MVRANELGIHPYARDPSLSSLPGGQTDGGEPDETADDRVRLVAQLGYDPANERAGTGMPFEVDGPMGLLTMNLGPAMRTAWTLMLGRNQAVFCETGIGHDFFPQRASPGRDHLNDGLHDQLG